MSNSLLAHELQDSRLPCPSPSPNLFKLMSIESMMSSIYFILCCPLLLLPSVSPSIRIFSNKPALHIRWPTYGSFSFSKSASDEYSGLNSFRLTNLISLQSKGLSRVFSSTIIQNHQFFSISLCYGPTLTSIHDY